MATKPFYIHQTPPAQSFIRLPNFLFEAPSFCSLSCEAKLLYAMILRRTDLSRKNGWADDYGKIYLYYPINEVCKLLHCGRQKRWTRYGSCNMPILYPAKSRVVENPTASTPNTMKRFRTPTSRNPVTERRKSE